MTTLRIGDLARLGGVSVRMLRHYHELELLVPIAVDPTTGYRFYETAQLDRLQTIVALKTVGIALADIGTLLADGSSEAIKACLQTRQHELRDEAEQARANISKIDHYLKQLTEEKTMSTPTKSIDVEIKPIAARLVAQLSGVSESWAPTDIGPVIQPLYPELIARMEKAGVEITGPSTAWYEDTDDGRVAVHATLTIAAKPDRTAQDLGFEVVELAGVERAATTIHHGTMDNCDETYQALLAWVEANGHQPVGYGRELDIECGPDQEWITELQLPLAPEA